MSTLILLALTAYFAFNIGRRWDAGKREEELEARQEQRQARGRRGAMELNPIRIRR